MRTASLCLEVYSNLHTLSCVLEALLGSWPVFIEIRGIRKFYSTVRNQPAGQEQSCAVTHVWKAQVLCVILREGRNAAVINVTQRTRDLSVTVVQAESRKLLGAFSSGWLWGLWAWAWGQLCLQTPCAILAGGARGTRSSQLGHTQQEVLDSFAG